MGQIARNPDQDLTRVCAWCGCVVYQGRSQLPSHGICARCLALEMQRQREEARRWGHRVDDPPAGNPPTR
jgi:hypothetical protein